MYKNKVYVCTSDLGTTKIFFSSEPVSSDAGQSMENVESVVESTQYTEGKGRPMATKLYQHKYMASGNSRSMDTDKSHSMATGTFKKPLRKKVRRGGKRHSKRKHFSFSLLGNNVAGLQGKAESLDSLIKYCAFPSCITLQETKLGSKSVLGLNGY